MKLLTSGTVQREGMSVIEKTFSRLYSKFRINFYKTIMAKEEKNIELTTMEAFYMEILSTMERPTISEFADFVRISAPNATYRINSLIKKGYVRKVRSDSDRREYCLELTQKYIDYMNISTEYVNLVMSRIEKRFPKEELKVLEHILSVTVDELMPEADR